MNIATFLCIYLAYATGKPTGRAAGAAGGAAGTGASWAESTGAAGMGAGGMATIWTGANWACTRLTPLQMTHLWSRGPVVLKRLYPWKSLALFVSQRLKCLKHAVFGRRSFGLLRSQCGRSGRQPGRITRTPMAATRCHSIATTGFNRPLPFPNIRL